MVTGYERDYEMFIYALHKKRDNRLKTNDINTMNSKK